MSLDALFESELADLPLIARGKVRDIYGVDDDRLLIVTTDRLSAYDVVLPDPVPGKGATLTTISNFWFGLTADLAPNHLTETPLDAVVSAADANQLAQRAVIVRRLKPLPIEAVVRGYLIGSGWRDYLDSGKVCGVSLPAGLEQASRLDAPIFTPATKAQVGEHDENISYEQTCALIGDSLAARVRDLSLAIYARAARHALARGIVIADTKFEFGLDDAGTLYVIDEMLTPDSSRFWPEDSYRTGISPPSYDKQYVRDYLDTLDWDKTSPGPNLPREVLEKTAAKYREALTRLTGPATG